MENICILIIVIGALLIALFVAECILDRIIVARRKKFAVEINQDIENIEDKIDELEAQIESSAYTLSMLSGAQRDKCLAELTRLRVNLANLRKNCERMLQSVESEEMYDIAR